jgi:hypothetical protein
VSSVPIANLRLPFDAEWSPATGRARVVVGSSQASIGGGRLTGRLVATRSTDWTIDGGYRFYRVNVASLLGNYGRGRLTGRLTLGGRNVQSVRDVEGVLVADLEDAEARSIPVVSQFRNFVPGAAASGATTFSRGRLEARLAGGVVHVEELALASAQLQAYLSGRIDLSGRLRLEATVASGEGNNPIIAEALLSRLAAVASAPATVLAAANDYLANRVIHLAIGGTIDRPVIRIRPYEMLREEAVRFFLQQATGQIPGASVPAAGVANGAGAAR